MAQVCLTTHTSQSSHTNNGDGTIPRSKYIAQEIIKAPFVRQFLFPTLNLGTKKT